MTTGKEYITQVKQLHKIFPEVHIFKPYKKNLESINKVHLTTPFDLETGRLNKGEHAGKTLDEIYELDPAYILRLVYYVSHLWDPLHQLHYLKWTLEIRERTIIE